MQNELQQIEREITNVKEDQEEIKSAVQILKMRLYRIKERREIREDWLRKHNAQKEDEEREKLLARDRQIHGVSKEGPIAIVSMAKAMAVATFVGKSKDNLKKED